MSSLAPAHRGYDYQDLLVAARLVDVMLDTIVETLVDKKLVHDDVFDDLTTVEKNGRRERIQFKHSDKADKRLTLATFTNETRGVRLDRVVSAALAYRDAYCKRGESPSFRIVLTDTPPTDQRLLSVLVQADNDPGPFLSGMDSVRMRFCPCALFEGPNSLVDSNNQFAFLRDGEDSIELQDLEWVCRHLIIELAVPPASFDLTRPGMAEQLLLGRVQKEVGAGVYPNANRTELDVADALIRCARGARQNSLKITKSELLLQAQLQYDFGAVSRANPVNKTIEVIRLSSVEALNAQVNNAIAKGKNILLEGPPGQGKSWICQQLLNHLRGTGWLVAEHYCYLRDADGERQPRVQAERVFGSLLRRVADCEPSSVAEQRPRFAASEQLLETAVQTAIERVPSRHVALVVDGIDHVTRVTGHETGQDSSFALAEALASLELPNGSILIVLSQPGQHLEPLVEAGAQRIPVPELNNHELRKLADKLGVFAATDIGDHAHLPEGRAAIDEFVKALSTRSAGNALYATYLCKEVLQRSAEVTEPSETVYLLPAFDGTLRNYYEHIATSLGEGHAWVADVMAFLDFPVSPDELKEIRPDAGHRVDRAIQILRPVLTQRVTEGGLRIYHESFARFLRLDFQGHDEAKKETLNKIIEWLEQKGIFQDTRAFYYLLPLLSEVSYDTKVVGIVSQDFVVKSIASGFQASAIIKNLAIAVRSAMYVGDWPAIVRFVEMCRSADAFEIERVDSVLVDFIDVVVELLDPETVVERLMRSGCTELSARSGLQICAALDTLGKAAPWREYLTAYQSEQDDTFYADGSVIATELAYLRGRLRIASSLHEASAETLQASVPFQVDEDSLLSAPINWSALTKEIDNNVLPEGRVVAAILDTFGMAKICELIEKLEYPGPFCLAVAEEILEGRISDQTGDALYWANRAANYGLYPGGAWRLIAIGVKVAKIDKLTLEDSRDRFLELTRKVLANSDLPNQSLIGQWMDSCTVVANKRDRLALNGAEALVGSSSWFACWMRFAIALSTAEVAPKASQSELSLNALHILTEVQNPFVGQPRACDLHEIEGFIKTTFYRAISLLEEETWEEGIRILERVSNATTTTLFGELGGPLPKDELLGLVVDTVPNARRAVAQALIADSLKKSVRNTYYSYAATFHLFAARLAIKFKDIIEAQNQWTEACKLLVSYAWHKDITIFELLDPLPTLTTCNYARGRAAIAMVQPLCDRVLEHTDGKETSYAIRKWWKLLAAADPCGLSQLIQPALLKSCNDPRPLLHEALSALWRVCYHRADPVVAGALRLTLEEPLNENDPCGINHIASAISENGDDISFSILPALMARFDERPYNYNYSDSEKILAQDQKYIDALNVIANRTGAPLIAPMPPAQEKKSDLQSKNKKFDGKLDPKANLLSQDIKCFKLGATGIAGAVRALHERQYEDVRQEFSPERFGNLLGYRLLELLNDGRKNDVDNALISIADTVTIFSRSTLLKYLAEGFARFGFNDLAAKSYALAWTRARGGGGWLTFGGETEIDSLKSAACLDLQCTLATVAEEVERMLSRGANTYGITQGLIYGFALAGLAKSSSTAFDLWEGAFSVIENRIPRLTSVDGLEEKYLAPVTDNGMELLGDINLAFASAAVAGLAHPGLEQKRRSLLATRVLIEERPTASATAIKTALQSLSDPTTLTWLLRLIELIGSKAKQIVSACREELRELAVSPHLTIRVIARRLLGYEKINPIPYREPDRELVAQSDLLIPEEDSPVLDEPDKVNSVIEFAAAARLEKAEYLLPGLRTAVRRRVKFSLKSDRHKSRMNAQRRAYVDERNKRFPNILLATFEAVEDAIQQSASGARIARLMNGEIFVDPVELEEQLGNALLDNPEIPLALELTRQPRPNIPSPPHRDDELWRDLTARAKGQHVMGTETAFQKGGKIFGSVSVQDTNSAPAIVGGVYGGWRLLATFEERDLSEPDQEKSQIAYRYCAVEMHSGAEHESLLAPPIASENLQGSEFASSIGDIGYDISRIVTKFITMSGIGILGFGMKSKLLAPGPNVISLLRLKKGNTIFVLEDGYGPALSLLTWRTEYQTSNYHLPWPRLNGMGIVVRSDAFDRLVCSDQFQFRDFVRGPESLFGYESTYT